MKQSWMRRRWLDFRFGHGVYLIFVLTFANFVLIFHRLLVERVEFLNEIFSQLWMFAGVFVLAYIPLATVIGAWHRRTQLRIESEQIGLNNPFLARNFRMILDTIEGNASKDDIRKFREFLIKIEKKSDYVFFKDNNEK